MNHHQFETVREELRVQGGYLADPSLLVRCEWFEETKERHRLVSRWDAEQYMQALDATGQALPPPSVELSAIVRLKTGGFFMTACAGWTPHLLSTTPGQKLADVRPSAWTTDPGIPALYGDFDAGWNNLAQLIKGYFPRTTPRAFRKSSGAINWSKGKADPSYGFQIRHRLFEVILSVGWYREAGTSSFPNLQRKPKERDTQQREEEDKEEDDEEEAGEGDEEDEYGDEEKREEEDQDEVEEEDDPRFLIENWPVQNAAAQLHLDALKPTHIVNPIPAYDVEGQIILPTEYERQLRGAIVRLEFRLTHRNARRHNFFSADVVRIRVLVPPYHDTSTRKRLSPVDDFYDNYATIAPPPFKRMRLTMEEEGQFTLF